jgi:hypothetical protein
MKGTDAYRRRCRRSILLLRGAVLPLAALTLAGAPHGALAAGVAEDWIWQYQLGSSANNQSGNTPPSVSQLFEIYANRCPSSVAPVTCTSENIGYEKVVINGAPMVSAYATLNESDINPQWIGGSVTYTASADATLYYQLYIAAVSPAASSFLSVPVVATGNVSGSGIGSWSAEIKVSQGSNVLLDQISGSNSIIPGNGNFKQTLSLVPGDTYDVSLTASADVQTAGGDSETAFAMADPSFEIAPSCGCAQDFEILLSPGISNGVLPVPEPSSWAMLLLGFTGLSIVGYRRSVQSA